MFILRTSFQQIPEELYEAALIDGANDLQTLIRIALPLSKAVLATLLMFYAVAHWNDFFNALIFLNDRAKYPIQLIMRNIVILGRFEQTNELGAAPISPRSSKRSSTPPSWCRRSRSCSSIRSCRSTSSGAS